MTETAFPSTEYEVIFRMQQTLGMQHSPFYPVTIGDDAAVRTDSENNTLVITTDLSVEDIHFSRSYMTMREIGYRAMVANVSDCAAMGAVPDSAFVQLVVPAKPGAPQPDIEDLYTGFREACDRWQFPVAGGDLSRGNQWVIGITMLGRIPAGRRTLLRKGMQAGDRIFITGFPGRSAAGLHLLQTVGRNGIEPRFEPLARAHFRPSPQVETGYYLSGSPAVHAMMDCSDGLSKDCGTLCHENGLGIILDVETSQPPHEMIELSSETGISWHRWFLHGGEDYELLFTASAAFDPQQCPGCRPICIGECTDKRTGLMIRSGTAFEPLTVEGFDHFSMP